MQNYLWKYIREMSFWTLAYSFLMDTTFKFMVSIATEHRFCS